MRLSSSSSLVFATLALSSSSSTLAAPTADAGALQQSSFPSSPSLQSVAMAGRDNLGMDYGLGDRDLNDVPTATRADRNERRQLPALLPAEVLNSMPPPLQNLLQTFLAILGLASSSAPSAPSGAPSVAPSPTTVVTPAQLDSLKKALAQALQEMNAGSGTVPHSRALDSEDGGDGTDENDDDDDSDAGNDSGEDGDTGEDGDSNDCIIDGDNDSCDDDECDDADCSDNSSSTPSKRRSMLMARAPVETSSSSAMPTDSTLVGTSTTLSVPSTYSGSSTMSNTAPTSPALPANPPNTPVPTSSPMTSASMSSDMFLTTTVTTTSSGDATETASSTMA